MRAHRFTKWALSLGVWTLLGFFFATQTYITYLYSGGSAPFVLILRISLGEWYVWAVLAPAVVWLARRFPIERSRRWRSLLVLVPASLVFTVLKLNLDEIVRQHVLGIPGRPSQIGKLHFTFLTYWAIVGVAHALEYYRRYRDRELRASQLEARLAQARLEALQMQLQPHFLFNTLHAISTLMHRDVEAADRMVTRLSDLLRLTLESAGVQEVPLKQEVEFLEKYLEIEQTRFQDRLTVQMEIPAETLDALVPNLILQPLVENAIRHGIAPRAGPGRIEIFARRAGLRLEIEIRDDGRGPGRVDAPDAKEGLGLANTRARLAQLYPGEHVFDLGEAASGGARVRVSIPFRAAPPPEEHSGKEP